MRITCLCLLLLTASIASGRATSALPLATQPTSLKPPGDSQLQAQNETLRGQLEAMKSYDQKLLNTVYFSLSTVILLVLALVGLNLFSNLRIYQRDRETFRAEIKLYSDQQSSAVKTELAGEFGKLKSDVDARLEKFELYVNEVNEKLQAKLNQEHKRADEFATMVNQKMSYKLDRHLYDYFKFTAKYYESTNNSYKSIEEWVGFMEVVSRLDWADHHAKFGMEGISEGLKADGSISYTNLQRLLELLKNVPPHMSSEVDRLQKQLGDAKKI